MPYHNVPCPNQPCLPYPACPEPTQPMITRPGLIAPARTSNNVTCHNSSGRTLPAGPSRTKVTPELDLLEPACLDKSCLDQSGQTRPHLACLALPHRARSQHAATDLNVPCNACRAAPRQIATSCNRPCLPCCAILCRAERALPEPTAPALSGHAPPCLDTPHQTATWITLPALPRRADPVMT
jgi:hypothetical protein